MDIAASNSGLLKVTLLSTILWIRISATGFSYCKMDGACALLMGGINTSFQSIWNVAVASSGQLGGAYSFMCVFACVCLSVLWKEMALAINTKLSSRL